jgi:mono/diheme cytochrome c family protein
LRAAAALVAGLLAAGAVLLALGGPARSGEVSGGDRAAPGAPPPGRAVFARMGCGGCHRLAAGGGGDVGIGPDLDTVLPNYTAAALRAKIVDPYPAGDPTSFVAMPQDFGSRMSAAELGELVAFLLATTRR